MAASNASTKNSGAAKAKRSHWSVRELVTLAIFSALGMALSFIQIPIFPPAPYLQYDPSGIVTLTVALMYGPAAGIMVQLVSWIPKLIMSPLGSLLTFVAMIGAVLIVGAQSATPIMIRPRKPFSRRKYDASPGRNQAPYWLRTPHAKRARGLLLEPLFETCAQLVAREPMPQAKLPASLP